MIQKTTTVLLNKIKGKTQQDLFDFCRKHEFPGSKKYPPEHPIWLGYTGAINITPKNAWYDDGLLKRAIRNFFYIISYSKANNKYHEFVNTLEKAVQDWGQDLIYIIQRRFTVAKIAPQVSRLKATDVYRTMELASKTDGVDFSGGVFVPMAGFGGIVAGAQRYFKEHELDQSLIEAYDINPEFCSWYGWTQRDVLDEKITTRKPVLVCPPFGNKHERWIGTPNESHGVQTYCGFDNWVGLIHEYVKSPYYIFFGPTQNERKKEHPGLFAKISGIRWYPEHTHPS